MMGDAWSVGAEGVGGSPDGVLTKGWLEYTGEGELVGVRT